MSSKKFILIVGGGHLGYYLTKALINEGNEVVLIERDKSVMDLLIHELGDNVVFGDGTEIGVLKMAGIERADIVVSTTGYDDDNFTIALIAKKQEKSPKTVVRLRDPNNEHIFKKAGIDETVCSTSVILNLLEQQIDAQPIIPITALDKGNIELLRIKLDDFSPVIDTKIKDIDLPLGNLIISIIRGDKSYIPTAESILSVGDELYILIQKGTRKEIEKYFIYNE